MLSGYSVLGWSAVLATTLRHVGGDPMATVTVTYQYDSGATVEATVEVADSYPDSLDQAKVTAVAALRDTMASFEDEASE